MPKGHYSSLLLHHTSASYFDQYVVLALVICGFLLEYTVNPINLLYIKFSQTVFPRDPQPTNKNGDPQFS